MKSNYSIPQHGGIKYNSEAIDIITSNERIDTKIFKDFESGIEYSADEICKLIVENESLNKKTVLCLSSGETVEGVYGELIKRHKLSQISFANVIVFVLDEFYPYVECSIRGEKRNIYKQFLNHIDIKSENIYSFSDNIPISETNAYCDEYEKKIEYCGGIDLVVMGIGTGGEIGYNDAGSAVTSQTRLVAINSQRRKYTQSLFNNIKNAPSRAFTLGISNILNAKKIMVMAWSEDKAVAIQKAIEENINSEIPASFLQLHRNCKFVVSRAAASELTREKTPWLVGKCEWDEKFVRKAVVWLCKKVQKPILKLTEEDYQKNGLNQLIEEFEDYSNINITVFNQLQHTITGWPGGKPNCDDTTRPERATPYPKRVIIFSPHPDDDVISMGGTAIRLHDQGHDVHIAYQTSGNIAVGDDYVLQIIDTARECGLGDIYEETLISIKEKTQKEDVEPVELRRLKGSIRRAEAKAACRSFGLNEQNTHFLNLPFYETGAVKKSGLTQNDIDIVKELIREIAPHQIYAAGDLSDPHGTHRTCIEAVLIALEQLSGEECISDCRLWLYRGAWQEWDLDAVDMAVPLSPSEVIKKRHAIFRHASQKDIVPFPGEDTREFWQRAEDRTHSTANTYDKLGMAEYEAIEVFVEYNF